MSWALINSIEASGQPCGVRKVFFRKVFVEFNQISGIVFVCLGQAEPCLER